MTTSRYSRDNQRYRLLQTMIVLAGAVVIALSLTGVLAARSNAAIDCTTRSIETTSAACHETQVSGAQRTAR